MVQSERLICISIAKNIFERQIQGTEVMKLIEMIKLEFKLLLSEKNSSTLLL